MSKIKEFLDDLDEVELAFFAKFKLESYLPDTQKQIQTFLTERKMDAAKIERLISARHKTEYLEGVLRCPRCHSEKLSQRSVEWTNNTTENDWADEVRALDGLSGRTSHRDEVVCLVCGYWLSDPNREKEMSFWQKIRRFFGGKAHKT